MLLATGPYILQLFLVYNLLKKLKYSSKNKNTYIAQVSCLIERSYINACSYDVRVALFFPDIWHLPTTAITDCEILPLVTPSAK